MQKLKRAVGYATDPPWEYIECVSDAPSLEAPRAAVPLPRLPERPWSKLLYPSEITTSASILSTNADSARRATSMAGNAESGL